MYEKILVAYDGSSFSDVALHQGSELARLCKAKLHLVGIIATSAYLAPYPVSGGADLWAMEKHKVEEALEGAVQNLSGQGLKPKTSIREGNPTQEIANCATKLGADLVVVGHSDKGVIARWFEGSVGAGLIRDLPCNLLVATS